MYMEDSVDLPIINVGVSVTASNVPPTQVHQ